MTTNSSARAWFSATVQLHYQNGYLETMNYSLPTKSIWFLDHHLCILVWIMIDRNEKGIHNLIQMGNVPIVIRSIFPVQDKISWVMNCLSICLQTHFRIKYIMKRVFLLQRLRMVYNRFQSIKSPCRRKKWCDLLQ